MQDIGVDECPMPEPFRDKIGITVFIAWLFFLGFVTRVMFAPLMPAIERDLGINHSQAGSLFLLMSIGYLLAPFCSGLISSRINHRGALKLSAWAVGVALLPFTFVNALWPIRFLLVMIGLSAGVHLPSAIATITAEVQKKDWGKALSVHQCAPPLSFVSAPIVAAVLLNWFSWRYVLVLWALLALASALAFSYRGKGGDFPGQLPSPQNVKQIIAKPSFWIMVLLFAMAMGGNAGIYSMLPLFFVNERGFDLTWANTLIGLSQTSGVIMVFVAGWITDRIGQIPSMVITLLATAVLTVLLGLLENTALVIVLFLQPAVLSSFFPAAFAALSRIAPPSLRSVTNALGPPLAFLIGGGVLPAVIGYMGETYTFSSGIVAAGGFMAVGPLLLLFLKLGQYDDQSGC
ncbi:MAG: MFS transporter [Desulfobacteraceae bacterium]|jgi:NNP family nitrate/nitrite transporter-like MFS transporter